MEDYRKIAIELGQTLISKAPETREDVERMLPELREGEDERIRKELIEMVRLSCTNGDDVDKKIAWLEKQGEQKIAWSEEDKNMLEWVIGYLENKMLNAPISEERTACKNAIDWLLEKQGEQKSTNKVEQKGMNIVEEDMTPFQKKVFCIIDTAIEEEQGLKQVCDELLALASNEIKQNHVWSEEDETTKNNISHIIRQYEKISKRENQPCWYVGDCLLWMQNIKDRVQLQPKREWSEEDEKTIVKMRDFFIRVLGDKPDFTEDKRYEEFIEFIDNRLASLRPQNRWKPSDEQIKSVKEAACYSSVFSEKTIDNLISLSKQLKKLMEE